MRTLSAAERDFITTLASSPEGMPKHAAFIYGVLREPLFDTAIMASAMAGTVLTAQAMTHIAERW